MGDSRNSSFMVSLLEGKGHSNKLRKRFKDVLKSNLKELEIHVDNWEALTENHASWKNLIRERCGIFEQKWVEHAVLKRALRMQDDSAVTTNVLNELKCSVCGRFLLSKTDLVNHLKSHGQWPNEAVYEEALPGHPTKHTCPTCDLVCKSAGGLTRYSKIHKDVPQPEISNNGKFKCYIHVCERTCKTKAGLKSHLREHDRTENN